MSERLSSAHPSVLTALRTGLYGLTTLLLLVYYLVPLHAGQSEFAWWTPIAIGVPFALALLVPQNSRTDGIARAAPRSWRDPRLPSAQER